MFLLISGGHDWPMMNQPHLPQVAVGRLCLAARRFHFAPRGLSLDGAAMSSNLRRGGAVGGGCPCGACRAQLRWLLVSWDDPSETEDQLWGECATTMWSSSWWSNSSNCHGWAPVPVPWCSARCWCCHCWGRARNHLQDLTLEPPEQLVFWGSCLLDPQAADPRGGASPAVPERMQHLAAQPTTRKRTWSCLGQRP